MLVATGRKFPAILFHQWQEIQTAQRRPAIYVICVPIAILFREVVFFDFALKCTQADLEDFGGLRSVAAGVLKRATDRL